MAFGVFIHRFDSIYDDSPAERYQFPRQYFSRVQACIGSWIVYYEPRKVPCTRGYFAVAKVERIAPDPSHPGMFFAVIEPGSYLDFSSSVPFNGTTGAIERGLLNNDGKISGRAQSAVRLLSLEDFQRITDAGLNDDSSLLPRDVPEFTPFGVRDVALPYAFESSRDRIDLLTSRVLRDRVFRRTVLSAYDERCAVTGLKLINGGGRAEVEAAHIRPVKANGPDIVSNGIALSGTAHWMFDRGLITLNDDLSILISRQVNDSISIEAIVNKSGLALAPMHQFQRPHPQFLAWHREYCFKS